MWFKKKNKPVFVTKCFTDCYLSEAGGRSIGDQINDFQKEGYEFVTAIGSFYSEHSNANYANVLFKKD